MKLTGFSIYDSKAEAFTAPFFQPTPAMGIRTFGELCRDPGSPFSKHPRDFELFKVGEFDDSTGSFGAGGIITPVLLSTGLQALES
ncbi:MAG: nonstructural protein [Microviridae sp.]|nr:MAG: nonstructural protein [Microviridae sp.]